MARRHGGSADRMPHQVQEAVATYHWLYEEFLEAYDPVIRRQMGAYYTP